MIVSPVTVRTLNVYKKKTIHIKIIQHWEIETFNLYWNGQLVCTASSRRLITCPPPVRRLSVTRPVIQVTSNVIRTIVEQRIQSVRYYVTRDVFDIIFKYFWPRN